MTGFETALAQLARTDDQSPVAGRTVERVEAAGKHLLLHFSGGLVLRTHQRMHGAWHLYRPGERWRRPRSAMRVVIRTAPFEAVAFDVPVAEFLDAGALARAPALRALGPDLLSPAFDAAEAVRRLRAQGEVPIADALLDQRVLAGIGNVFKSELLFEAGLHPDLPVSSIAPEALPALVERARRQLAANVSTAPRVGGARGRRTTGLDEPGAGLWVYGRAGEPCRRCGTAVAFDRRGPHARVTYFCPRCQPSPGAPTPPASPSAR